MSFPSFTDEKGEQVSLTHGNFAVYRESADAIVRKNSFEAYFGEFKKGKLNGFGMIYDDMNLLIGEFKDNDLHGIGMKVINYKSRIYVKLHGRWNNGRLEKEYK